MDVDRDAGIGRLPLNTPERRNAYDPAMRDEMARHLDDFAMDDDIKVILLRGEGGVFSTGADMGNAYSWYGDGKAPGDDKVRRPSQRRRLAVDRRAVDFYHMFLRY